MSSLHPIGPDLVAHNLEILAERLGWPAGAREVCRQANADHPGWNVGYRHADRDRPAGFFAIHNNHQHLEPPVFGATADELDEAIRGHGCKQVGW